MWGNPQLNNMFMLMVMLALVRVSWERSQRQLSNNHNPDEVEINPNGAEITLRQREWVERAVRGYRAAQENRVWQRWNRSMFEPTATSSKSKRKFRSKPRTI